MSFQNKLLELRKNHGLSQKKLADELGVAQSSINYWEKGQRTPSFNVVQKIADYFRIPVNYFYDDWQLPSEALPAGMVKIGDGDNAFMVDPIEFVEHFNNVAKQVHPSDMSNVLNDFFKLNAKGQKEAARQIKLLTKIPEYRKAPE